MSVVFILICTCRSVSAHGSHSINVLIDEPYLITLYSNKLANLEEMDSFLEKCNLPRLIQEETENLNRPITSNGIELVIKNLPPKLPQNQTPSSYGFTAEFNQTLKKS